LRYLASSAKLREKFGTTLLSDLDPDQQRKLLWKEDWCTGVMKMQHADRKITLSDKSLTQVIPELKKDVDKIYLDRIGAKKRCGSSSKELDAPSPSQLRRWLKKFRDAGYNLIGLYPQKHLAGNTKPRFDDESESFAQPFIRGYACNTRPTMAQQYGDYGRAVESENLGREAEGKPKLVKMSRKSFERRVDALDPYHVLHAREGAEAAKKKFGIVRGGLDVERPLERVEMDEWLVSLQTLLIRAGAWAVMTAKERAMVERTRVWLTAVIDCATRCILALRLSISAPSSASAIAALEMIVTDKTALASSAGVKSPWDECGVPETVAMDSGPAFIADATQLVIRDMGASPFYPPSGLAEMRGRIESLFSTFQRSFINYFPGQTFSNVVNKGEYDSEGNTCLSVEELNRTLIRYVVDVYHNTPHSGLVGETPRNAWLRLTERYGVLPPLPPRKRRHIFGIPCQRRIGHRGIRFMGLHYQSQELQMLRREMKQTPVLIRVSLYDLSEISVRTPEGWMFVTYNHAGVDLKDVTIWHWIAAGEHLKRHNYDMASVTTATMNDALDAQRATAKMAAERAELGGLIMTTDMIDKADKDLFRTFAFAGEDKITSEDFLDVPKPPAVQQATVSLPAPTATSQYGNDMAGWSIEE